MLYGVHKICSASKACVIERIDTIEWPTHYVTPYEEEEIEDDDEW